MRRLITGAAIILIALSIYGLLKTFFDPNQSKARSSTAGATTPTPSQNIQLASTTPTLDPTPQFTPTPTPASRYSLGPLESRVVIHQSDQFRKGAIGKDELVAINNAIKSIPWSRNSNPAAAANEDYSAIVKECEKSGEQDLLADLVTEALSNDYQPNNEVTNSAYSAQLNLDFENGPQSESPDGKSTGGVTAGQETSIDSGLIALVNQPSVPANSSTLSPAQRPASAEVIRSKIVHLRHRVTVRHRVVDAKMRLIELWHQSLTQTEKSPK